MLSLAEDNVLTGETSDWCRSATGNRKKVMNYGQAKSDGVESGWQSRRVGYPLDIRVIQIQRSIYSKMTIYTEETQIEREAI